VGPPLLPAGGSGEAGGGEPVEAAQPLRGEADPLVSNGLASPSCRSALSSELSATVRRNCETSGFLAAPASTNNYGIDVHIDTGLLPFDGGTLLSLVQDLLITPLWLALVWVVHALIVMLEWCFALDLMDGGPARSLQVGLAQAQATLTVPWLALSLSFAAVAVAYHGLVRRQVAETLGEALMTGAMLAGGFWLMLDPAGTVGALTRWSNQAGIGTLAVATQGTPEAPGRALGAGMNGVFAATIEAPWCYLEFGEVEWCRDPARLDPRLREAGLRIAAREQANAGCRRSAGGCTGAGGEADRALSTSARLLREARTNGALFLALPANGPARNSINESGSLLRTLCQTATATSCVGPGAAEAEFRTNGGTWSRVGGLLLIALGLLGMMMLLGYIALRLLLAALLSLFYLLLAPGIVLAPAFGERGRALFRAWAARLFGAVISKLIFAFLLGAVLAVMALLEALGSLGWWAQWLLMSAFWWGTFVKRHELLAAATSPGAPPRRRSPTRPVTDALRGELVERWERKRERKRAEHTAEATRAQVAASPAANSRLPAAAERAAKAAPQPSLPGIDRQAQSTLEPEQRQTGVERQRAAARIAATEVRSRRIKAERDRALLAGDSRRAALLAIRGTRLDEQLAVDRRLVGGRATRAGTGASATTRPPALAERSRLLDEQAALPSALTRRPGLPGRDYPALSGLAGYTRRDYQRLDPGPQRAARLRIDRELAARREQRSLGSQRDRVAGPRLRQSGARPAKATTLPPGTPVRSAGSSRPERAAPESDVMRDAREVAAGRKRQLGIGRP
jgi:hypothetical protein